MFDFSSCTMSPEVLSLIQGISNARSCFCGWEAGMDYRQKIIELINKTNNTELLELIYRFCKKLLG